MAGSAGKIVRYAVLPGILPRALSFVSGGFPYIATFMAQTFYTARVLPAAHPYLNPANAGRFGIRHVFAEARRHIAFRRQNTDQVIIFYTLLLGMALLMAQFALVTLALSVNSAEAMGLSYSDIFQTDEPEEDAAFQMLDRVFGIENLFESDLNGTPGWPSEYHTGLHYLFRFYNMGLLSVAFIILIYYIFAIVAETAQSGVPFGKRFNTLWAVTRAIFAAGLLTPMASGMCGGQILTLHVAKWGSSMATNSWQYFINRTVTGNETPIGNAADMIVIPKPPPIDSFLNYMAVAQACFFSEQIMNSRTLHMYQINGTDYWELTPTPESSVGDVLADPPGRGQQYQQALINAAGGPIVIRLGELAGDKIIPVCGDVALGTKSLNNQASYELQRQVYNLLYNSYTHPGFTNFGRAVAQRKLPVTEIQYPNATLRDLLTADEAEGMKAYFNERMGDAVDNARTVGINNDDWWDDNVIDRGWVGAGMSYNRIADLNGSFVASAHNIPIPVRWPAVMLRVESEHQAADASISGVERFNPSIPAGKEPINFKKNPADAAVADAEYFAAKQYWVEQDGASGNNLFADMIKSIFGLEGLFNMRQNSGIAPLAQLVGIGQSLIQSATMNLGVSMAGWGLGKIADFTKIGQPLGAIATSVSGIFKEIAMIALGLGFLLGYLIPFMPFIYFFFAVGGWVKSLFEAMVGVPLWALAHMRIDGDGLPGPTGMNGYYLLLEIMIRPTLIVVGFIGAIVIFSAQINVLNIIWPNLLTTVTGSDPVAATTGAIPAGEVGGIGGVRDSIDSFFFTLVYGIIVYMLATASFKLIDQVPNHILRWIGGGVQTFNDSFAQDQAAGFIQNAYGMISAKMMGLLGRN